jgi:two-component system, NtrC family, nitrogen regulation sensor histidine kinase GlnL
VSESKLGAPSLNTEPLDTSLVDHLTTAIIVLDGELRLRHLNPAAEALLETSKRSCQRMKFSALFRDAGELPEALQNVMKDGSTFIARKIQWELSNGNKLVVDYAISTLDDLGDHALLLEIQGLDRAYQISRKELFLSSHETTQELVRGLGHEIKNPLGGIRGAAQLLAAELNATPSWKTTPTSLSVKPTDS